MRREWRSAPNLGQLRSRWSEQAMELYEPINTLKPVGPEIWIADGPIVRMAMYGTKIPFPTRMTVVRLQSGELWCHSPIAPCDSLQAEVDALGPVRHLVSPNKIHYAHIGTWAKAYPEAIAWASPGVRDRAAQQNIPVTFHADLTDDPPPQWRADLDQLIFRGSRFMDEAVFFHRASSTLIVADLIENFELNKVQNWGLRMAMKLSGCSDPDGKMPLDLRLTFMGQKAQGRECLHRLLQWHPEKVILAHGRWYPSNGEVELKRALRWLERL
ncbi:DUF4336 domain-containing protein [Phormidium sp. CCY1219]|nr:DUF4336 domain-containing protein [Phormidium sp. CCY1219]